MTDERNDAEMTDNNIHVPLPEREKVYVVEMTESEYRSVIGLLSNDPSQGTDAIYRRMCDEG